MIIRPCLLPALGMARSLRIGSQPGDRALPLPLLRRRFMVEQSATDPYRGVGTGGGGIPADIRSGHNGDLPAWRQSSRQNFEAR